MYLMIGFPCEWLNFVKFAFAYILLGKLPMQAVGREQRLKILESSGNKSWILNCVSRIRNIYCSRQSILLFPMLFIIAMFWDDFLTLHSIQHSRLRHLDRILEFQKWQRPVTIGIGRTHRLLPSAHLQEEMESWENLGSQFYRSFVNYSQSTHVRHAISLAKIFQWQFQFLQQ